MNPILSPGEHQQRWSAKQLHIDALPYVQPPTYFHPMNSLIKSTLNIPGFSLIQAPWVCKQTAQRGQQALRGHCDYHLKPFRSSVLIILLDPEQHPGPAGRGGGADARVPEGASVCG